MNLKKLAPAFSILLAFAAALALLPASAQAPARKPRVAVLDFDYATVQTTSSAIFGTNVDIGKGITDLLITGLVNNGTYSVFERQTLDKLMAEQNFSNSNRADPSTAAKLGKLAGVDYIIIGAITQFGNETKKQNLGGVGGNWHGVGVGGFGHSNSKAEVGISARIVNVNTGEIVAVAEGSGESARSSTSLLGGGGNWGGFGGGKVDFGSSNFEQTIIGQATKAAVDQLSSNLVSDAPKLTVAAVKIDGVVAGVDGGQIILNLGSDAGVKAGDQFEVIRVTKEIKDPTTGDVIRRLTTSIGIIKATDVDARSAVCVPVSGSGFREGDHVRSPQ
jgi:curli biogenesis system outer membrane secretion channel CsgG